MNAHGNVRVKKKNASLDYMLSKSVLEWTEQRAIAK
jgi:hypothetical protein